MPEAYPLPSIAVEAARIRALSRRGRHREALAAAEALHLAAPDNRDALYLIAANLRCLNRIHQALRSLERLGQQHPGFSLLYQERGHCYVTLRDRARAIDAFRHAVKLNPALEASWTMLARLYREIGNEKAAATAAEQASTLKKLPCAIVRAGSLFADAEFSAAENLLREYLANTGGHFEALRLLARIEQQREGLGEAERLLESALALAPNYRAARLDYARVLLERQKYLQASEAIDRLRSSEPDNRDYLSAHAAACVGLGLYESAIATYRQVLAASPLSCELQVTLGHALKSVGRQTEAIESYHRAVEIRPGFGDAYWSLANLKTYRFREQEVESMRTQESAPAAHQVDRYHLCFSLGKAYEDQSEFRESWRFYELGNALKRAESRYQPEFTEINTRRQIEVCTNQFFTARRGAGVPDPDPIFIVGLPRSGSTLLEQILASHSQVEGTHELANVPRIAAEIEGPRADLHDPRYPGKLTRLRDEDFRMLGQRYLAETRAYRGHKPYFVDKMPNNFRHLGLIQLILPNAKIIDVRREPMACCLGNLKQLFASGQEFTYRTEDIARYYRTYLELMRHWDAVLPGRVLRVWYEDVVGDLEASVRRILEFCGLEWEPLCLEFHKTHRSVRTASSEQVRLPIFRDGLSQWRNYERWLAPLKDSLGDALIRYRE